MRVEVWPSHGRNEWPRRACEAASDRDKGDGRAPDNAGQRRSPDNCIRIRSIRLGSGLRESGLYCRSRGPRAIPCGGQTIKGEFRMSTVRSLASSAARQPGRLGSRVSGRLAARIGQAAGADRLGQTMRSLEQSLTGRCPQLAVTRERHRRERSTAALTRAIVWLRQHQRRAPPRPALPVADRR